ncbi:MAG: hypothetical protein HFF11_03830 [Angelakisella sp.]|jgi:hypothetical protein|nr:hypothetical protein [Angelakisella sp.]
MRKGFAALLLAFALLAACAAAPEAGSVPPPETSASVSLQPESTSGSASEESGPKPLSRAKELPVSSEPVELKPDQWEIPPNPHYQGKPYWERVWWVHGRVLRITEAEGYDTGEPESGSSGEASPLPDLNWDEYWDTIDIAETLTPQYLCDEAGNLLYPDIFYYIYFREDYLNLTNKEETFFIRYDGTETDLPRLPVTKAQCMEPLPDGTCLGYLWDIPIHYDREGNQLSVDTTQYQLPLPNGAVLDAAVKGHSLLTEHITPYLRDHPDPVVQQKINDGLEEYFSSGHSFVNGQGQMTGISHLTFSADCTGHVLHVKYDEFWRPFRTFSGDWFIGHILFDLNTGEVCQFSDLFADGEGAKRLIYEKASEKYADYSDYSPSEEVDRYFIPSYFFISGGSVCYETRWTFSRSKTGNPVKIPLEEFAGYLDREGSFYRALTQ